MRHSSLSKLDPMVLSTCSIRGVHPCVCLQLLSWFRALLRALWAVCVPLFTKTACMCLSGSVGSVLQL